MNFLFCETSYSNIVLVLLLYTTISICNGQTNTVNIKSQKDANIDDQYTSVDFKTDNWLHDPLTVNFRRGKKRFKYRILLDTNGKTVNEKVNRIYSFRLKSYPKKSYKKIDSLKDRRDNYGLAGIRLIFEPQFGTIFQTNTNRLDKSSISVMPKFGLETNVWGGWVTIQTFIIFPVPSVAYDAQSPILSQNLLSGTGNTVNIDYGVGWGLSFLDGIFAIGYATLHADARSYNTSSSAYVKNLLVNPYVYFNIQTISAVRKILKGQEKSTK